MQVIEPIRRAQGAALVVAAALLPFESDRVATLSVAGTQLTGLECALLVVAGLQGLAMGLALPGWWSDRGRRESTAASRIAQATRSPAFWALALVGVAVGSAAMAPAFGDRLAPLRGAYRLTLGALVALAVGAARSPRAGRPLSALLGDVLLGSVSLAALLGLLEHHLPGWWPLEAFLQEFRDKATLAGGYRRLTGPFAHANLAGLALAAALPLAGARLATRLSPDTAPSRAALGPSGSVGRRATVSTAAHLAALALILLALVTTVSRTALVAGMLGLGLVLARRPRLIVGAGVWLALALAVTPGARHRLGLPPQGPAYAAEVTVLQDEGGRVTVALHNRGWLAWRAAGTDPVRLVLRRDGSARAVRSALSRSVAADERLEQRVLLPGAGPVRAHVMQHGLGPIGVPRAAREQPASRAASRHDLWPVALALWRERPLLGWGADTFRLRWPARRADLNADPRMHANQLALELLADMGALGLLAFLGLAVTSWLALAGSPWRAALLAWLAHGALDCGLFFHGPALPLWLAVGAAIAATRAR